MEEDDEQGLSDLIDGPKVRLTRTYQSHSIARGRCRPALPIKTTGAIPSGRDAWVYIAETRFGTKIGITTNPQGRSRHIAGRIMALIPVVPAMARAVETAVLVRLGQTKRGGEYVSASVCDAEVAAHAVMAEYRRMAHVDPELSAEDARKLRITLAMPVEL